MEIKHGRFTDTRDGLSYGTVRIGNQIWFAENLRYDITGSKVYDDDFKNCGKYGRLYTWKMAFRACPPGCRLPSESDWNELVNFVGGESVAGKELKSFKGWDIIYPDNFGFSAVPGGLRRANDGFVGSGFLCSFSEIGVTGAWWSSTENDIANAIGFGITAYDGCIVRRVSSKKDMLSIRCIVN